MVVVIDLSLGLMVFLFRLLVKGGLVRMRLKFLNVVGSFCRELWWEMLGFLKLCMNMFIVVMCIMVLLKLKFVRFLLVNVVCVFLLNRFLW